MPTPKRAARRRWISRLTLGALLSLAGLAVGSGCSLQGEGERCDPANNDADCESGLVCVTGDDLVGLRGIEQAGLCCPKSNPTGPCLRSRAFTDDGGGSLPPGPDAVDGGAGSDAAQGAGSAKDAGAGG